MQANYHMGRTLGAMTGTDDKFYMEDLGAGFLDFFITRGYAIATGSLNVLGTNNDDVKSAETVAKVKEHFIKQFGEPLFTIGHGASGGSMQQHLIANAYPGLLDGIMPGRSYADVMTFLQPLYDCELLQTFQHVGTASGPTSRRTRSPASTGAIASATARAIRTRGPTIATPPSRTWSPTIRS